MGPPLSFLQKPTHLVGLRKPPHLVLREDELTVFFNIEDPLGSLDQYCFHPQGLFDFVCKPCSLWFVVSLHAVNDLDPHRTSPCHVYHRHIPKKRKVLGSWRQSYSCVGHMGEPLGKMWITVQFPAGS